MRALGSAVERSVERQLQFVEPAFSDSDGRYYWHAKRLRQRGHVDRQPVAQREVEHIERNDNRPPKRDQLHCKAQMVVEIGGIDNNNKH